MRKLLKAIAVLLSVVLLAAGGLLALAWWKADQALARRYTVNDPPLSLSRDTATLALGAHLFATRGCADCHGADGTGKLAVDAGPVGKLIGPNITSGGVTRNMSADQIAAAIRHGVKPDGHPMIFMPTGDFHDMGDADTAALVAYVQSLPPSANDPGATQIRPLGYVLYLFGKFPMIPAEKLDHAPRARATPAVAATAEYGKYIAQGCTGCHGSNFAGQHVPGTPPDFPDAQNLTPANIGAWTNEDFRRALRTGKRPDGSAINEFMPWRTFAKLSDTEIDALWAYIDALPAVQSQKK
jgi:cytochrome c553